MSDSFANAPGLEGMAHGFMVHRQSGPPDLRSQPLQIADRLAGLDVADRHRPDHHPGQGAELLHARRLTLVVLGRRAPLPWARWLWPARPLRTLNLLKL